MEPLRWGIVGFGWVARDFMAPAITAAGDRLVAVSDPAPSAQAEARRRGARTYDDPAALSADPMVEAVYVATPNHLHRTAVEAAAAAGKAVLCEKPIAADIGDAEATVAACRRARVLYGTAFDQRHHPAHRVLRDVIQQGRIGAVTAIRIVYACWLGPDWTAGHGAENWRVDGAKAGGGALMDLAPHGLDLVQYLLDEPIDAVSALLQRRVHDYAVDDGALLIGQTRSGVLMSLHVAYNCPDALPRRRLEVTGSAGMIVAENTMGQDAGGALTLIDGIDGRREEIPVPDRETSPFLAQVRCFRRALRTGAWTDFSGERDLATMRLLDRAYGGITDVSGLPHDLPDAARAYVEALPKGRLVAFPMTGLDRTGVPAWKVALFLDDDGRLPGNMPSGYGYGTTDGEAITGALAEIAEAICPTLRLMDTPWRTGSYRALAAEVGRDRIVDPLALCLPAGSPVDRDTPLAWTEAVRARNGERVLVPLDVAATDVFELPPGYRPFTTLITNGLGAGPDLDWAVGHGLLECLQRDGNGVVFRALDQGVLLDLGDDLDAETRGLVEHLDGCGLTVLPKFASDEFGLVNLYVVGYDQAGRGPRVPIMLSACGEACDPDRNRALRKALLEFCSARVRKTYGHGPLGEALSVAPPGYVRDFVRRALPSLDHEEGRALRTMMDWARDDGSALRRALDATVFQVRSRRAFASLPSVPLSDTRERGAFARRRLEEAGYDVLYIDGSPRDRGIAVAKVIVPGLEVETMSYGRIGERNTRKLLERDSPLIRFGDESDMRRPIRLTEEAADRLRPLTRGRRPLFDTAEAERVVGSLYPLYREPEAHHVALRLGQIIPQDMP